MSQRTPVLRADGVSGRAPTSVNETQRKLENQDGEAHIHNHQFVPVTDERWLMTVRADGEIQISITE